MEKHHCHCGLERHLKLFRARRVGLAGVIILVLHALFHVVECLILPSLIIGFSGHLHEAPAAAESLEAQEASLEIERTEFNTRITLYSFEDSLELANFGH